MADNKTASLTVLGGPLAGTLCELPESGTLTIGSSPDSTLYLDLLAVSPFHARVVVDAGRVSVHDTGSSRTVHVNDNAIGPEGTELRNGDILWLGAPGDDEVVMLQCILPKRAATPTLTPPGALSSGATPTPEAVATDGLLDLCTFAGGSLLSGLRYAAAAQLGGWHRRLGDCQMHRARRFRMTSEEPVAYQLDGDPGGVLPVDVEVLPLRVTAVVPATGKRIDDR